MQIIASEPISVLSASQTKERFKNMTSAQELADAFALASNQFWWVEDNEYDYEKGTMEHKAARAITNEWGKLMDSYANKILETIHNEGTEISSKGRIVAFAPFMKKHGYGNQSGWWVKSLHT